MVRAAPPAARDLITNPGHEALSAAPGYADCDPGRTEVQSMFRFLGWAALVVFIIGLLVVFGVIDFIF